ncbi:hypothetical protein [Streptomyces kanamyceticus]|uniref:UL36 very large tegument protein n=1 Tax=Streptomyces kanamyceticus TaxID=1967 RepID=A0A5J6G7Q1_STRKN|nr:hypothetical protein [Streptomyces kanamyceticus]QEU90722.1 hypothetical protein CP970_07150 [Streptomyces kanamyceticus]
MAVGQLPDQVREFAKYLRELLARLDQGAGWCGVFWQRDPDGMRACLDGAEVPPWDVVQALLHDLAADRGVPEAERETGHARVLHRASLTAYDARPGGRELLGERLDMMLREQRYATERQAELTRQLTEATGPDEADRVNLDLAWVRDDHERATARCVELQERLDRLDAARRPSWVDLSRTDGVGFGDPSGAFGGADAEDDFGSPFAPAVAHADVEEAGDAEPRVPEQAAAPVPEGRSRRRAKGGARFAGFGGGADADPEPGPEGGAAGPPAAPRGARFAHTGPIPAPDHEGVFDPGHDGRGGHDEPDGGFADEDERITVTTVRELVRLRGEGRSGEAHGVLVEAAGWPAARLPELAGELHRAGLGADWATLLWEVASLPPDRLVAVADALAGAGRADDCRKLLRQGVARPAPEMAEAMLGLIDAGREREARALLDSYLRVRTPEDAARCAHTDPNRLIPLLLETAKAVSDEHHWDLVHALRVAGFSA